MSPGEPQVYEFGPFRLDRAERQLWCDGKPIGLTDKVFELLLLLVQNRGRTLSKLELMGKLWPDTVVEENNLTVNVSMLRKALGESASERRYVETLARRGYRFIADVRARESARARPREAEHPAPEHAALEYSGPHSQRYAATFVGRERELARLEKLLARAAAGRGRIVLITGSPGMGKTELCEQFLLRAHAASETLFVSTGHCLEQYGTGEAYLPFLEALQALLSGVDAELVAGVLKRHAPSWCSQFPAALGDTSAADLRAEPRDAGSARMLRELADALEALSQIRPVVLVLEDLHWADPSSSDLLRLLGQRVARSRVLLLATLRAEQVELENHPMKNVKRELLARDQCDELALPLLERAYIARYLDARLHEHELPGELAELIFRTTEGQPLFATRLVQLLMDRGDIQPSNGRWALARQVAELHPGVPDNVRGLIQKKLESLGEAERRALSYASVIGVEFNSAALASLLAEDETALEEQLDHLTRAHRMVDLLGEERLPDGRLTVRYRFAHVLYQNVLYESVASKRRALLHGQIAEALLAQYGSSAGRIAAQLAAHFKAARSFERAIPFLMQAADNASRLHAKREAWQYYADARALVAELPEKDRVAHDIILSYNRGWTHWHVGEHTQSIAAFELMLECARAATFTGGSEDAQRAQDLVFAYFAESWQDAFALAEMPRMQNQTRAMGPAAVQCEAYWAFSYILLSTGRWDEMGLRTQEYLQLAEASHNEPRRLEALAWMAVRELELGQLTQGAALLDRTIPAARAIRHTRALGIALHARAKLHHLSAEHEQAEALYTEALGLAYEALGRIGCTFGLGAARAARGRVSEAITTLNEALDIAQRTEDEQAQQMIANALGDIHLELEAYAQAGAQHQRALELGRRQGLSSGQLQAALGLARAHLARAESERAARILDGADQLLSHAAAGGQWQALGQTKHWHLGMELDAVRAEYWLQEGQLDRAERHSAALLAMAQQYAAPSPLARARFVAARVRLARGHEGEAMAELQAALALLAGRSVAFLERKLLLCLGALRWRAGDAGGAREAARTAAELTSGITRSIADAGLRSEWESSATVRELNALRQQLGTG